ncbi:MAG: aldo/keto reductase [Deltaproteobacteria bacterium]|nr:aldo/keto reductase [Deltaproteobacteria bacterium]
MLYRKIGRTGYEASILSMGCMRLPMLEQENPPKDFIERQRAVNEEKALELIEYAIEHGINYFDSAYMYHAGNSELILGKAIKGKRDKLIITTKSPVMMMQKHEDFDRILDEQLKRLDTDHLDFYLLHGLVKETWEKAKALKVFDFLDRIQRDGRVKNAGFSFHDKLDVFRDIIDAYPWAACQIQYNYFDENYQAGKEGLKYATSKGIGVIVMEPLRGGRFTKRIPDAVQRIWDTAEIKRSPAEWGLRWVANHPDVSVILSGMTTMEQLKENIGIADEFKPESLTQKELGIIDRVVKAYKDIMAVGCTTCNYCMPCPNGVNIPMIFSLYNDVVMFKDEMPVIMYNTMVPPDQNATNCIECGECEDKCPQHIEIISNLKDAHRALYNEEWKPGPR